MQRVIFGLISIFLLSIMFSCSGAAMGRNKDFRQPPALYNMNHLNELREKGAEDTEVKLFIKQADDILDESPVTIMDRKKTFAPNAHYYCSISRYSWPSDNNPNVYVIKDGLLNPEFGDFNRPNLDKLANCQKTLSVAYYITEDEKYYNAFCKQLDAWFLAKSTYMKPTMEYAQVVQGHNNNKGMEHGLVDLNQFTPVIESILLIKQIKDIETSLEQGIIAWFSSMLDWALKDKRWERLKQTPNNIVSSLYVCFLEMARYIGRIDIAEILANEYTEYVIDAQIDEEGKQPAELSRVAGFGYSVSNLVSVVDFCLVMEQAGIHYYRKNQRKIDSAFSYLLQYVGNEEAFPYTQNGNWGEYENRLERNVTRLSRLSAKRSKVKRKGASMDLSKESVLNYVY